MHNELYFDSRIIKYLIKTESQLWFKKNNSFIEIECTYHKIHPFKVHNSVSCIQRVVRPSPLFNFRTFSSSQMETQYPLAVTPQYPRLQSSGSSISIGKKITLKTACKVFIIRVGSGLFRCGRLCTPPILLSICSTNICSRVSRV